MEGHDARVETGNASPRSDNLNPQPVLRDKSQACQGWFEACLEISGRNHDWLEQKSAEFNCWISSLNVDKRGPGALDTRLGLRLDVRDVVRDVLDGLESALIRYYEIATSESLAAQNQGIDSAEDRDSLQYSDARKRSPSPWLDMSDRGDDKPSSVEKSRSATWDSTHNQSMNDDMSLSDDESYEQLVFIDTNLTVLTRIHTAIKRSGLKFRNQKADKLLKEAEERRQLQKASLGDYEALMGPNGDHEKFRRYLTGLVLWNGYTQNLVQRIRFSIDMLAATVDGRKKQYPELLLKRKLLVVFRAYFNDPARLSTVQRRLIEANVTRRNRLAYAGNAMRKARNGEEENQFRPLVDHRPAVKHSVVTEQPRPELQLPKAPDRSKQRDAAATKSFVTQPATAFESDFSMRNALERSKATKSAATKMSAKIANLDYPKCPIEDKQIQCPYCPAILTKEYKKKQRWRGHVAQDLCPYVCVFENCEAEDDMFASTYEWMSHMASSHSEISWNCLKCSKQHDSGILDAANSSFPLPALLKDHIFANHAITDPQELKLLVEAGKQVVGIQKVTCPLCRPGLVTHDDSEAGVATNLPSGRDFDLVQLEEDEHVATHIHEFALRAIPTPEGMSPADPILSLSHSSHSTKAMITFDETHGVPTSSNFQAPIYSLADTRFMLDELRTKVTTYQPRQELTSDIISKTRSLLSMLELGINDLDESLLSMLELGINDLDESLDTGVLASSLNDGLIILSQLTDPSLGLDSEDSLQSQLIASLSHSQDILQQEYGVKLSVTSNRVPKILSLDGGGVLSKSSLLILEEIMEKIRVSKGLHTTPKPCEYFDLIGGSGTGGVIAIMLGRLGMTVAECISAFDRIGEIAFTPKPSFLFPAQRAPFSAKLFEHAIEEIVQKHCNESSCVQQRELGLSTVLTCPHSALPFRSQTCTKTIVLASMKDSIDAPPTLFTTYDTFAAFQDCTICQIARAAVAAEGFFKPITLGRDRVIFLDANFGYNNPCEVLILKAGRLYPVHTKTQVLSLGSGLGGSNLVKSSSPGIAKALQNMEASSLRVASRLEDRYGFTGLYYRLNVERGLEDVTLSDWRKASRIAAHTAAYMREKRGMIDQVVHDFFM